MNNVGMIIQRHILLLKKGKTTQFIENLLFDAQQWSNFRALLQIHVRKARDLQQDFEEKQYLCAELETNLKDGEKNQRNRKSRKRSAAGLAIEKLSKGITRMELEVESEIKKLDGKIKDMIELVSTYPIWFLTDIIGDSLTISRNSTWFLFMRHALQR